MLQRLKLYRQHQPLGFRLLAAILLCSSLITLFATGLQLYLDYRYERSAIDERILQIETTTLNSLSTSLWAINPEQVQVQLSGIKQLPDVELVQLDTPHGEHYQLGVTADDGSARLERSYPLSHTTEQGRTYPLGTLRLVITLEEIIHRLEERVALILTTQGIKTFLVSIFILTIFNRLVTQHLSRMAQYARQLTLNDLRQTLTLKRKRRSTPDELSEVVNAFNEMRQSLIDDIAKREAAEQALARLNTELEQRVSDRTRELEAANQALHKTLDELKATQAQLVESEKMAALGGLVAGVAHEISTPMGIGFTAASWLRDQAIAGKAQLTGQDSSQAQQDFYHTALDSSELICQNLERASQLISAFKQVSVDQSSEQPRCFDVCEYLAEILVSMQPRLKQSNPEISIRCDQTIELESYPGAFYQIISNLLINSLIHGFDNQRGGHINLDVSTDDKQLILDYRDNGQGIPAGWEKKLFEPFVTSRRHQGCSGLGMHICYNLTSQLLHGEISCLPSDQGAHFRLRIPLQP
ncbi:sensor histidine kinase, partial [Marinobacterium jannaschii]|uniref:sensor histidine kinase n=1 Tax=Marinobacterium jannaschii TaxID=64970 RepID=UPI00056326A8